MKASNWAEFLENDKLGACSSVKLRECYSEVEQEDDDRKSISQVILRKKHGLLEADHRASRKDKEGSQCRMCARIAIDTCLKITSGGYQRRMGRSSATESWSYGLVRTAEKPSARCAALKLLANQQLKVLMEGLQERSRQKTTEELRKFITMVSHEAVKIRDVEKAQEALPVKKPKITAESPKPLCVKERMS